MFFNLVSDPLRHHYLADVVEDQIQVVKHQLTHGNCTKHRRSDHPQSFQSQHLQIERIRAQTQTVQRAGGGTCQCQYRTQCDPFGVFCVLLRGLGTEARACLQSPEFAVGLGTGAYPYGSCNTISCTYISNWTHSTVMGLLSALREIVCLSGTPLREARVLIVVSTLGR